ncbi:MAG: HIT domain-containing protein [Dehalococcoidia bacterium]|nr:HIT domain-containing protein [Dehalococcoidia bacterium]
MKHIWAPWRIKYIEIKEPEGCFLCDKPKQDNDAESYILHRGRLNFVILNSYPYNPGHLMVAPYRHIGNLEDLTVEERNDHYELVSRCVTVLKQVLDTQFFNIGMNLGRVSGAGVADHIHTHIVPRWNGDTNFMPVVADTKVLPEAMADTYKKLKAKFS